MRTVNLVATPEMIRRYFPDARDPRPGFTPGIMSADFPIDPAGCNTKLGAWLAERIFTTRRDDDVSLVRMVMPVTDAGAMLTNLGKAIAGMPHQGTRIRFPGYQLTEQSDLNRAIESIRKHLTDIELQVKSYGQLEFNLRTEHYQWPVFGSKVGGIINDGVDTPERFFDYCAREILQLDGVIIEAGFDNVRPDDDLLRTMHHGSGLELVAIYDRQKQIA